MDEEVPVLVIGVREDYRRKGIGGMLITEILKKTEGGISLCVSKENQAYKLYLRQGFTEFRDIGDSIIMVSKTHN
jgi:ribosomal protein S18 acetylase RimI-like enzyme